MKLSELPLNSIHDEQFTVDKAQVKAINEEWNKANIRADFSNVDLRPIRNRFMLIFIVGLIFLLVDVVLVVVTIPDMSTYIFLSGLMVFLYVFILLGVLAIFVVLWRRYKMFKQLPQSLMISPEEMNQDFKWDYQELIQKLEGTGTESTPSSVQLLGSMDNYLIIDMLTVNMLNVFNSLVRTRLYIPKSKLSSEDLDKMTNFSELFKKDGKTGKTDENAD